MGAFYRNIKHLACENIGGSDAAADHSRSGSVNSCIRSLGPGPTYHRNKLKFIQLSKVTELQLLAVVVVEGNIVKNHIIELREPMDEETVLKLNLLLNTQLNGLSIEEINLAMISRMKEQAAVKI